MTKWSGTQVIRPASLSSPNKANSKLQAIVVDPDPKGSEPFSRIMIRIQIIGSDPDPELKGSENQFHEVKLNFSCFKA
jgi:hypothetical protein